MGLAPSEVENMTLWTFTQYVHGFNVGEAGEENKSVSEDKFEAMMAMDYE